MNLESYLDNILPLHIAISGKQCRVRNIKDTETSYLSDILSDHISFSTFSEGLLSCKYLLFTLWNYKKQTKNLLAIQRIQEDFARPAC